MKKAFSVVVLAIILALTLSFAGCGSSSDEPILGKWGEESITDFKADGSIEFSGSVNPTMQGTWQTYGSGTTTVNGEEYYLYQIDVSLDDKSFTHYIACSSDGSRYLEFSKNDVFQEFVTTGALPEQYYSDPSDPYGGLINNYSLETR